MKIYLLNNIISIQWSLLESLCQVNTNQVSKDIIHEKGIINQVPWNKLCYLLPPTEPWLYVISRPLTTLAIPAPLGDKLYFIFAPCDTENSTIGESWLQLCRTPQHPYISKVGRTVTCCKKIPIDFEQKSWS